LRGRTAGCDAPCDCVTQRRVRFACGPWGSQVAGGATAGATRTSWQPGAAPPTAWRASLACCPAGSAAPAGLARTTCSPGASRPCRDPLPHPRALLLAPLASWQQLRLRPASRLLWRLRLRVQVLPPLLLLPPCRRCRCRWGPGWRARWGLPRSGWCATRRPCIMPEGGKAWAAGDHAPRPHNPSQPTPLDLNSPSRTCTGWSRSGTPGISASACPGAQRAHLQRRAPSSSSSVTCCLRAMGSGRAAPCTAVQWVCTCSSQQRRGDTPTHRVWAAGAEHPPVQPCGQQGEALTVDGQLLPLLDVKIGLRFHTCPTASSRQQPERLPGGRAASCQQQWATAQVT